MSASFILSAASAADFPQTGVPEIAMVGRSNVGKSSLINALVKSSIARTSAAPGKTRLANYYLIGSQIPRLHASESDALRRRSPKHIADFERHGKAAESRQQSFYLVDLPGYGYARGGENAAREFEILTSQYFHLEPGTMRRLAGVLHLIDARHPELPQDAAAHQYIAGVVKPGLPMAVVATKMDKLKRAERSRTVRQLETLYRSPVLPESVLDYEGMAEIWKVIRQWLV